MSAATPSWRRSLRRMALLLHDKPWSLGFALGMMLFFTPHPEWHGDLYAFREMVDTLRHPYYARWLFYLMTLPPEPVAYVLLSLVCIALLYFAVRTFGGRHWLVFTSFAFAWTLIYGQIDALVVGGLAFAWWCVKEKHPVWLGAGLLLASIKPHLALPLTLLLWWWSPARLKSLLIPAGVFGLSLLAWGFWVPEWLARLSMEKLTDLTELTRNLSIHTEVGYWAWAVWPLIYALPVERQRKLIAVAAGTAFTMPYFPLPSSVLFLAMPVPTWVYWLLQIPALGPWLGYWLYLPMKVVPPLLLLWCAWPVIRGWVFREDVKIDRDV